MNFELLPIDETMYVLRSERDPATAFKKIVEFGNRNLSSQIWKEYKDLYIDRDIKEAAKWLQDAVNQYPDTT